MLESKMNIASRLKQERVRLKLSQSALARAGGVEANAQGNYESGTRFPKADYLAGIAHAGADVAYVITGRRASDRSFTEDSVHYATETMVKMLPKLGSNPIDNDLAEDMIKLYLSVFELHNSIFQVALNLERNSKSLDYELICKCHKIILQEADLIMKTIRHLTPPSSSVH